MHGDSVSKIRASFHLYQQAACSSGSYIELSFGQDAINEFVKAAKATMRLYKGAGRIPGGLSLLSQAVCLSAGH